jgi:hypothetical protein
MKHGRKASRRVSLLSSEQLQFDQCDHADYEVFEHGDWENEGRAWTRSFQASCNDCQGTVKGYQTNGGMEEVTEVVLDA